MAYPTITVNMNDRAVKKSLRRFHQRSQPERKRALYKVGSMLVSAMLDKISGDGFTKNPNRSSPYPGELHGRLGGSMFVDVKSNGSQMRCGPHEKYAEPLEFTHPKMPNSRVQRPFVQDSLQENLKKAYKILAGRMFGLLK